MGNEKAYTVTQINKYIKAVLDEDYILKGISIRGEVSNFSRHFSGHLYFSVKDDESSLNCVMFAKDAQNAPKLDDGEAVIVTGAVSVFVKNGQCQMYVKKIESEGKGGLYLQFEQLKNRLLAEGLFDDKYKKAIPENPASVAIVTSPAGAALKDIISVARRRNKFVKLMVFPALVQGDTAASSIAEAIRDVNRIKCADVIIVGRGGGSIEDLWAFNEEVVAKAIFESNIPVISAVGHQTDFTIADFAADLRAATPSVSAEIAIPLLKGKAELIAAATESISKRVGVLLREYDERLNASARILKTITPLLTDARSKELSLIYERLSATACDITEMKEARLLSVINHVEAVSPLSVLKRGYSVALKDGSAIKSVKEVSLGEMLTTRLLDGEIISKAFTVKEFKDMEYD